MELLFFLDYGDCQCSTLTFTQTISSRGSYMRVSNREYRSALLAERNGWTRITITVILYHYTVNVTILEESSTLSAVTTIEYGRVLPSILGIGADVSVAVKVGLTASY